MSDPSAWLLRLIWLASPALPVGGFSYSEGLESAVELGAVHDEASVSAWLDDQLDLQLARADLAVLAQALDAWSNKIEPQVAALNAWVLSTRESAEQRQQTEQMGRSMHQWLRNSPEAADARIGWLGALKPAPAWPIAFALAATLAGAAPRESMLAYAFGWAENMVQAALKAVPLGQSAGQRILARLAQHIPAAVDSARQLGAEDRQAFAPMLAILSSNHETQYSRLFRS